MIEVFKTNVKKRRHATMLLDCIHQAFAGYKANFDLLDCDKILRIKNVSGTVQTACIISLLQKLGFRAEVLTDETNSSLTNTLTSNEKISLHYPCR